MEDSPPLRRREAACISENGCPIADAHSSVFTKIGGWTTLNLATQIFYDKLLGDAMLAPFFEGVAVSRLRKKQAEFMAFAFGGSSQFFGKQVAFAHRKLIMEKGLNLTHFDRVAGHFKDTLEELGLAATIIEEAVAVVATTRPMFDPEQLKHGDNSDAAQAIRLHQRLMRLKARKAAKAAAAAEAAGADEAAGGEGSSGAGTTSAPQLQGGLAPASAAAAALAAAALSSPGRPGSTSADGALRSSATQRCPVGQRAGGASPPGGILDTMPPTTDPPLLGSPGGTTPAAPCTAAPATPAGYAAANSAVILATPAGQEEVTPTHVGGSQACGVAAAAPAAPAAATAQQSPKDPALPASCPATLGTDALRASLLVKAAGRGGAPPLAGQAHAHARGVPAGALAAPMHVPAVRTQPAASQPAAQIARQRRASSSSSSSGVSLEHSEDESEQSRTASPSPRGQLGARRQRSYAALQLRMKGAASGPDSGSPPAGSHRSGSSSSSKPLPVVAAAVAAAAAPGTTTLGSTSAPAAQLQDTLHDAVPEVDATPLSAV